MTKPVETNTDTDTLSLSTSDLDTACGGFPGVIDNLLLRHEVRSADRAEDRATQLYTQAKNGDRNASAKLDQMYTNQTNSDLRHHW
jgi:hypothetical protein